MGEAGWPGSLSGLTRPKKLSGRASRARPFSWPARCADRHALPHPLSTSVPPKGRYVRPPPRPTPRPPARRRRPARSIGACPGGTGPATAAWHPTAMPGPDPGPGTVSEPAPGRHPCRRRRPRGRRVNRRVGRDVRRGRGSRRCPDFPGGSRPAGRGGRRLRRPDGPGPGESLRRGGHPGLAGPGEDAEGGGGRERGREGRGELACLGSGGGVATSPRLPPTHPLSLSLSHYSLPAPLRN